MVSTSCPSPVLTATPYVCRCIGYLACSRSFLPSTTQGGSCLCRCQQCQHNQQRGASRAAAGLPIACTHTLHAPHRPVPLLTPPLAAAVATIARRYVTVDDATQRQLFYYLVTHEGPSEDVSADREDEDDTPLIIWLTGGPGCSSLDAFTYENGPFVFTAPGGAASSSAGRYALSQGGVGTAQAT